MQHIKYLNYIQFCGTDGTLTRDHDESTCAQSHGVLAGSYQVCSRVPQARDRECYQTSERESTLHFSIRRQW